MKKQLPPEVRQEKNKTIIKHGVVLESAFATNCEGSDSLCYLQMKMLSGRSFPDARRRQETPGSGVKKCVSSGLASGRDFMSVSLLLSLNPVGRPQTGVLHVQPACHS